MSTELPNLEIPPMECPAVLLPQPANLSNFFGGLASFPAKLIALAKTTASAEAEKFLRNALEINPTYEIALTNLGCLLYTSPSPRD